MRQNKRELLGKETLELKTHDIKMEEVFGTLQMEAINAKPEDMEKVKIGKYTQWILKNFVFPEEVLPRGNAL